ncbi:hypothetical protein M0765_000760 [Variovorax sp. S2]|uniref:hypothetical protein n=1 Tax=Variovorax sp. S12S4 TaxID=3029170 RepID=UPI00215BCF12|nr:hypothetical protein [Variovorax sp. S12S4]MCR8956310.1 hypothetical protein [Variovorax sp. S12S4]
MNFFDTSPERVRATEIQAPPMHPQQVVGYATQHGIIMTIALDQAREDALSELEK